MMKGGMCAGITSDVTAALGPTFCLMYPHECRDRARSLVRARHQNPGHFARASKCVKMELCIVCHCNVEEATY